MHLISALRKPSSRGLLLEIATGLDAPAVIIDHTRCSFCGMCAAFCPVRAVRMTVNDKDILELAHSPILIPRVVFNDNAFHA